MNDIELCTVSLQWMLCWLTESPVTSKYSNNNRFMALCPGLPGWASIRRNTQPPTIL